MSEATEDAARISQWVTSVANVESKSNDNLAYLHSILGPLNETHLPKYDRLQTQTSVDLSASSNSSSSSSSSNSNPQNVNGNFEHEIVFKINENVYIEEVNIYEKACGDSSIMRIEALKLNSSNQQNREWFLMWQTDKKLEPVDQCRIFKPIITPAPFKSDTIKLSISGSIRLIDAIGI